MLPTVQEGSRVFERILRRWPIGRFLGVIAGNGAATALSFGTSIFAARGLNAQQFVLLNTILTIGTMISVAGGGIDSAAARQAAQQSGDGGFVRNLVRVATRWRLIVAIVAFPLSAPLLLTVAKAAGVSIGLALVGAFASTFALTVLACALIEPQAKGQFRTYALRQLSVYLVMFIGTGLLFVGADIREILLLPFASLLIGCLLLHRSTGWSLAAVAPPGFRSLVYYLGAASILYAILDRVDTYGVVLAQPSDIAAEYSIAVRFAGGMALISSAFSAFLLPRVTQAQSADELLAIIKEHRLHWLIVAAGAALAALMSYPMIYLLFGREHAGAAAIASILIVQYPVLAAYIPIIVGMTHLGTRRWQIVLPLILLTVKIAFLPLAYVSPLLLALGAPIAHAVGGGYVYSRLRSLRTTSDASGRDADGVA